MVTVSCVLAAAVVVGSFLFPVTIEYDRREEHGITEGLYHIDQRCLQGVVCYACVDVRGETLHVVQVEWEEMVFTCILLKQRTKIEDQFHSTCLIDTLVAQN